MNYKNMSDFEINLLIAKLVLEFEDIAAVPIMETSVLWGDGANWHHFDPCNSWADAGPIIQSNGITLAFDSDGSWFADGTAYWVDGIEWQIDGVIDKNPLRAAMTCFLMMQEPPQ